MTLKTSSPYWQKHFYLPQDHGSWVFVFSPIIAGLWLAKPLGWEHLPITAGAIFFFLLRQPLTVVVKVMAGRRDSRDRNPALLWSGIYAAALLAALAGMIWFNQWYVLVAMAVPAGAMLAWQFALVWQRQERKQRTFEVLSTGLLAFIAPALVWVNPGLQWVQPFSIQGLLLWGLLFLQAGASIYYAYSRLEQRAWQRLPDWNTRLKTSAGALSFTLFNVLLTAQMGASRVVLPQLWLAFAIQFAETLYSIWKPAIGAKPTTIGIRQLVVSVLFLLVFLALW